MTKTKTPAPRRAGNAEFIRLASELEATDPAAFRAFMLELKAAASSRRLERVRKKRTK